MSERRKSLLLLLAILAMAAIAGVIDGPKIVCLAREPGAASSREIAAACVVGVVRK